LESGYFGDIVAVAWFSTSQRDKSSPIEYGGIVKLFTDRQLHLVKKALAMATLAVEFRPCPFESASDQAEMKALLREITQSEVEFQYYSIAAQLAMTDQLEEVPRSAAP
jgi:hypothetical protein